MLCIMGRKPSAGRRQCLFDRERVNVRRRALGTPANCVLYCVVCTLCHRDWPFYAGLAYLVGECTPLLPYISCHMWFIYIHVGIMLMNKVSRIIWWLILYTMLQCWERDHHECLDCADAVRRDTMWVYLRVRLFISVFLLVCHPPFV